MSARTIGGKVTLKLRGGRPTAPTPLGYGRASCLTWRQTTDVENRVRPSESVVNTNHLLRLERLWYDAKIEQETVSSIRNSDVLVVF